MSIFRNRNEDAYVGGRKHFTDVIKNSGPGELLLWLNPEEDFNTNSTLIVAESEEALFYQDGVIEQVFGSGKYTLSTSNYPFISRLRSAFSGGVSTFHCKVYFVRKAHTIEIPWGTDSPIQMRDPVQQIATSVQARGAFRVYVGDAKKFLLKLVGNNVQAVEQPQLIAYFRSEMIQMIKSNLTRIIRDANEEILGICSRQDEIAETLAPIVAEPLADYGLTLVSFAIAGLDIPESDPNRQRLEEAYAIRREDTIWGADSSRLYARGLLKDVANNPGSGGIASAGAGIGMGIGVSSIISDMTRQAFAPVQQTVSQQNPAGSEQPSGRFVQQSAQSEAKKCPGCGKLNAAQNNFCTACRAALDTVPNTTCKSCGASLGPSDNFCGKCGVERS